MLSTRPLDAIDRRAPIATKTPGRALLKSRTALQENAHAYTVRQPGKILAQQTPFAFASKSQKVAEKPHQVVTDKARPLGDKTPFPNRVNILEPRPSSTRKHIRAPRLSQGLETVQRPAQTFETPVTAGHHWDVSDIDIAPEVVNGDQSIQEDDHDEIEYMPPKMPEIPYAPPFDMPDYKQVGRTILSIIHSYPADDTVGPVNEFIEPEANFFAFEGIALPELDDDSPFADIKRTALSAPFTEIRPSTTQGTTNKTSRPGTTSTARHITNATSRPASNALRRPATGALSRPTSTLPRPATSVGISRPRNTTLVQPSTNGSSRPATRTSSRPQTSLAAGPKFSRPATSGGHTRATSAMARPNTVTASTTTMRNRGTATIERTTGRIARSTSVTDIGVRTPATGAPIRKPEGRDAKHKQVIRSNSKVGRPHANLAVEEPPMLQFAILDDNKEEFMFNV
ncbi:hypothetical protein BJ138DRAFT_1146452 [Hygrophoropsis aurantiaca]|uniref:Uncharacterized protein n=1 Tax=Hygrophoropsis aurantiaca TaxID=72124 RepID=A0ACB8AJ46_9AGAM|nr:hypothetical protein BJ138DRAFT_1146452 [Hygrophoropsis aurantiaca]